MSGNIGGNSLQYDVIQQGGDPQYGITDTSFQNCAHLGGGKQKQKQKQKRKQKRVNLKIEKLEDVVGVKEDVLNIVDAEYVGVKLANVLRSVVV